MRKYYFFLFVFYPLFGFSQPDCVALTSHCAPDPAGYMLPDTDVEAHTSNFVFDSFTKIYGGLYQYGSTVLKLNIPENDPGQCRWKLKMIIDNLGGGVGRWNILAQYGSVASGVDPIIDLLQVRITNGCHTALNDGVWQNFSNTGDIIFIISEDLLPIPTPAGSCASQVNGTGTYKGPNYGEYTFTIDYAIRPQYGYIPGYYNLNIKYCLYEEN